MGSRPCRCSRSARAQVVHVHVLTATVKACAPELHTRAIGAAQRAPAARGARGVILGTRAVRGAGRWRAWRVGQPVRPCLSRSPGRLRAKPARSAAPRSPRGPPGLARGENCGPRCSITVAPSRWRLPAQAASAKSEAQRGGHGGWPTAWATRGDAACRAAWLRKHLGSLEAPRSAIAPSGRVHRRHLYLPAPTCTYLRLPCNRLYPPTLPTVQHHPNTSQTGSAWGG